MKRFLIVLIPLLLIASASARPAFTVHMYLHSNDSISSLSVSAADEPYYLHPGPPPAPYILSITASNGSDYFSAGIEPLFETFLTLSNPAQSDSHSHTAVNSGYTELYFIIPLDPGAENLRLSHGGKTILDYPLAGLLCVRDGVCGGYETIGNCPADCGPRQKPEIPKRPEEKPFPVQLLVLIPLAALFTFLIYRRVKREREIY